MYLHSILPDTFFSNFHLYFYYNILFFILEVFSSLFLIMVDNSLDFPNSHLFVLLVDYCIFSVSLISAFLFIASFTIILASWQKVGRASLKQLLWFYLYIWYYADFTLYMYSLRYTEAILTYFNNVLGIKTSSLILSDLISDLENYS